MLPDETMNRAQVLPVFIDCRDLEAMPLRIELAARDRAPEHIAALLVVPHLRQAERDDEDIRFIENLAGSLADIRVVAGFCAAFVEPQALIEFLFAIGPLKLLHHGD